MKKVKHLKSLIRSIFGLMYTSLEELYDKYKILMRYASIWKILWMLFKFVIAFNLVVSFPVPFTFQPLNSLVSFFKDFIDLCMELFLKVFSWIKNLWSIFTVPKIPEVPDFPSAPNRRRPVEWDPEPLTKEEEEYMYRKYYKTDLPEEEPFIWYKDPILVGCGIILIVCLAWLAYHHYGTADGGNSTDSSDGGSPTPSVPAKPLPRVPSRPANSEPRVHFEPGPSLFRRARSSITKAMHPEERRARFEWKATDSSANNARLKQKLAETMTDVQPKELPTPPFKLVKKIYDEEDGLLLTPLPDLPVASGSKTTSVGLSVPSPFHGDVPTTPEAASLVRNPWGSNSAEYDNYFKSPTGTPPSGSPSSVSSDVTVKTSGLRVQTEGLSQPTPVPSTSAISSTTPVPSISAISSPSQVPLPPSAVSTISSPTQVPLPPSAVSTSSSPIPTPLPPSAVSASNSPTQAPPSAASSTSYKFPFDWEL